MIKFLKRLSGIPLVIGLFAFFYLEMIGRGLWWLITGRSEKSTKWRTHAISDKITEWVNGQ